VPINVIGAFEAIQKVFKGRALIVDPSTYQTFDFEAWCLTWDDAVRMAKVADGQRMARSQGVFFALPEVIVCTEYRGFGFKINHRAKPKFSRRNLYLRDRCRCQFCGQKFYTEDLTMDHVVPRSKGGLVTWSNIVLACWPCNNRKGNKTVAEAGMKLIRKPFEPKAEDLKMNPVDRLRYKMGHDVPKNWEAFLGKAFWNVELEHD
jgi:hypothetical protein